MNLQTIKRLALIILGTVALALGLIGMAVPVLPTTPFLLLAAYCYMRSSHRLYAWLLGNRLFGPTIRNYMQHRAIRRETRTFAMVFLWASLVASFLLVDRRPIRLLLLAIGIGVSWHLAALRILPAHRPGEPAEARDLAEPAVPADPADPMGAPEPPAHQAQQLRHARPDPSPEWVRPDQERPLD